MLRVAFPWLILAAGLGVAGIVLYVVADDTLEALSLGIIGIAAVVAISAVFYAVGISEDRHRRRGP